jgi:hypothetical protein
MKSQNVNYMNNNNNNNSNKSKKESDNLSRKLATRLIK